MTLLEILMWVGVFLTLTGIAGLLATAYSAWKLRQAASDEAELRRSLNRSIFRNQAALFVSVLGLMMVILGLTLR